MITYYPKGVCSKRITFDIENGLVKNVEFLGGCPGNLKAISKIVEGMPATEVIAKFKGINCRNQTSCSDQLATALEQQLPKQNKENIS